MVSTSHFASYSHSTYLVGYITSSRYYTEGLYIWKIFIMSLYFSAVGIARKNIILKLPFASLDSIFSSNNFSYFNCYWTITGKCLLITFQLFPSTHSMRWQKWFQLVRTDLHVELFDHFASTKDPICNLYKSQLKSTLLFTNFFYFQWISRNQDHFCDFGWSNDDLLLIKGANHSVLPEYQFDSLLWRSRKSRLVDRDFINILTTSGDT